MTFTSWIPSHEDFELRWDADHYFHFFESEDGDIFAYGHKDPQNLVDEVRTYDTVCSGQDIDEDNYDEVLSQVVHTWAKVESGNIEFDDDWKFGYGDKYRDVEGSFPLTVIRR